jgi:hypothetical protein
VKIQIDKDVPMPPPTDGRPRKYPFPDMAPGDSFAVPLAGEMRDGEDHAVLKLRSAVTQHTRRHGGKFTVRTDREAGEARCWRVE